ncbi:PepSY-associated TM helix domain-containing protein [Hyphomonas atlantica corrig.]|uniref:PepSY-associated TM helix domain-containing protein n=1 Tax=Hyphomonas atlantica TaxID=1280948 RepID=UPI002356C043|nr:PepSY-associated TM helix domain-containing protein [Hyphomonas atlantica]
MTPTVSRKHKRPGLRVRPLLVFWHRWFGLFAALWLALMGITGSAIVYYDELDTWMNPDLQRVERGNAFAPVSEWEATANAAFPDQFVRFVDFPESETRSARLSMSPRPGTTATDLEAYIDPYTAELLGTRAHDVVSLSPRYLMNFLYELHLDLHLGPMMVWFLGLVALLWILDHVAALILSFPNVKKWMASFKVRWGAGSHKVNFDLHRAGGLWFWPVTLVVAVSSLYLTWYEPFVRTVDAVSPITPRAIFSLPARETALYEPALDFSAAHTRVQSDSGHPDVDMASYNPRLGVYELRAFDPRDIDGYGRRMIVVDGESGDILSDRHSTEGSSGDVFIAWQYPLHSGKAFGTIGRIIIFASGFLVTLLCVTGIVIWAKKFRARRAKSSPR